jgi:hypothetical protein
VRKMQFVARRHVQFYFLCVLTALGLVAPNRARADLVGYVNAVHSGTPTTFLATNVSPVPTTVNIGAASGNITYEFIVNGNRAADSSALLGPAGDGQTGAIKFDQFDQTFDYGVTNYGVEDFDFGVKTTYGTPVVLDFVANSGAGTTALFANGVNTGATAPYAVTLSNNVTIGGASNAIFGTTGYFDVFSGSIFAVAVYGSALSATEIRTHANAYFAAPVPEPTTLALMILGAAGMLTRRRGGAPK